MGFRDVLFVDKVECPAEVALFLAENVETHGSVFSAENDVNHFIMSGTLYQQVFLGWKSSSHLYLGIGI